MHRKHQIVPTPVVPSLYENYRFRSNSGSTLKTNTTAVSNVNNTGSIFSKLVLNRKRNKSLHNGISKQTKCVRFSNDITGKIDSNKLRNTYTCTQKHCHYNGESCKILNPRTVIKHCSQNTCIVVKVIHHDYNHHPKHEDQHVPLYLPACSDNSAENPDISSCIESRSTQELNVACAGGSKQQNSKNVFEYYSNDSNSLNSDVRENMSSGPSVVKNSPFSIHSSESESNENENIDPLNECITVKHNDEIMCHSKIDSDYEQEVNFDLIRNSKNKFRNVAVQVSPSHQYRLRFLPICGCGPVNESDLKFCGMNGLYFFLRLAGRWFLSQCGLGVILFIWALLGSAAFQATEGPREEEQIEAVKDLQAQMAIDLATELRLVKQDRPVWRDTVQKYIEKHEVYLLDLVGDGYGEGGAGGRIWSYAGCFLFSVSLLTTLGFGAPVPRTTLARISAVIFAIVGIPLHLLLTLNVGMLLAVKLQKFAKRWQHGTKCHVAFYQCCFKSEDPNLHHSSSQIHGFLEECDSIPKSNSTSENLSKAVNDYHKVPKWLQWFPVVAILSYYTFGVLVFGLGRSQPFASCLLFPLDFTAAGGVGNTNGITRICYAFYLEGAVMLAFISVSVLQVSATRGMTELGLKLGLLTNS